MGGGEGTKNPPAPKVHILLCYRRMSDNLPGKSDLAEVIKVKDFDIRQILEYLADPKIINKLLESKCLPGKTGKIWLWRNSQKHQCC